MHREHLSWFAGADWGRMPLRSGKTRLSRLPLPVRVRQLAPGSTWTRRSLFLVLQSGAADLLISPRSSWQARHSL